MVYTDGMVGQMECFGMESLEWLVKGIVGFCRGLLNHFLFLCLHKILDTYVLLFVCFLVFVRYL